jgi:hypothetical protein
MMSKTTIPLMNISRACFFFNQGPPLKRASAAVAPSAREDD